MSGDIALLDLRLRRRLIIGHTVGIAAYAAIVVALYPSFKNDTSLNQLTENGSAVAAALGASGTLTSPPGWLSANLYANFVPLIVLLATIGYGASCIAGQDEEGTLGLVTTLPLRRRTITVDKMAAMVAQALPVPIVDRAVRPRRPRLRPDHRCRSAPRRHRRGHLARLSLRHPCAADRRERPEAAAWHWESPQQPRRSLTSSARSRR